jgi:hypothetical protein
MVPIWIINHFHHHLLCEFLITPRRQAVTAAVWLLNYNIFLVGWANAIPTASSAEAQIITFS